MKKIQILLLLAFSLFMFTGCSQKEPPVIFKNKMVCFDMQKTEPTEKVSIRVHKEDIDLFIARSNELQENLRFYESQIDRYTNECKKDKELKWIMAL